jgi:hypothetical protein
MLRLIDYDFPTEIKERYNIIIRWNLISIGLKNGITINKTYFKVDETENQIYLHADNLTIILSKWNNWVGIYSCFESLDPQKKSIKCFKSLTDEEMKDLQLPEKLETIIETPLKNPEL